MAEVYSIRESLQGRLQTFVRGSGLESPFLEDLIRDLVVLLSAYREEDVPMFPAVYVGLTREDLSPILTTGKPVKIGQAPRTAGTANVILKDCAPLAKESWAIFVHLDGNVAHYGLFRASRHFLSTGADEVIADLGVSVKLLMLRNCGHQSVEIYNTSKGRLTTVLKVANMTYSALDQHLELLVAEITKDVADSEELKGYLKRVLIAIVQHCHGTLMAVVPKDKIELSLPNFAGVMLTPCIEFASLHAAAMKLPDPDSLADLRAAEVLLEGMIGSDGIVVFGSDASVRVYRSFIKPDGEDESGKVGSEGGARRRAFSLLQLRLGKQYSAAFYRSQDGETKCEVDKNVK
jgi:hypothetical protein